MEKKTKKKVTILIITGILLILLLTCLFAWYIYSNNKEKNNDNFLYNINVSDNVLKIYADKISLNDNDLNYSQDNVQKLIKYLDDNFEVKEDTLNIDYNNLDNKQFIILYSAFNNFEAQFEVAVEDYKYCLYLAYNDDNYIIYLKDNDEILVKKVKTKSNNYAVSKVEDSYVINFSEVSNTMVINYLKNLFINNNATQLYKNFVRKDEKKYIDSLVNNSEDYLLSNEVKLMDTIKYVGINCVTPIVYLYDDNSYEYYTTCGSSNTYIKPTEGTYNYIIDNLFIEAGDVSNLNEYYIINDYINNETYYIDSSAYYINELLNQMGINLATCETGEE